MWHSLCQWKVESGKWKVKVSALRTNSNHSRREYHNFQLSTINFQLINFSNFTDNLGNDLTFLHNKFLRCMKQLPNNSILDILHLNVIIYYKPGKVNKRFHSFCGKRMKSARILPGGSSIRQLYRNLRFLRNTQCGNQPVHQGNTYCEEAQEGCFRPAYSGKESYMCAKG